MRAELPFLASRSAPLRLVPLLERYLGVDRARDDELMNLVGVPAERKLFLARRKIRNSEVTGDSAERPRMALFIPKRAFAQLPERNPSFRVERGFSCRRREVCFLEIKSLNAATSIRPKTPHLREAVFSDIVLVSLSWIRKFGQRDKWKGCSLT